MDVNSIVGIVLFIVVHTAGFIWWMSKMTTTLVFIQKDLALLSDVISKIEGNRYSKEDAIRDFGHRDQQIEGIWKRIDELRHSHS